MLSNLFQFFISFLKLVAFVTFILNYLNLHMTRALQPQYYKSYTATILQELYSHSITTQQFWSNKRLCQTISLAHSVYHALYSHFQVESYFKMEILKLFILLMCVTINGVYMVNDSLKILAVFCLEVETLQLRFWKAFCLLLKAVNWDK